MIKISLDLSNPDFEKIVTRFALGLENGTISLADAQAFVDSKIGNLKILKRLGRSNISDLTIPFVVGAYFQVNMSENAKVKIRYVDPDIACWLPAVVAPRPGYNMTGWELQKKAKDSVIIAAFGTEGYRIDMAAVWEKLLPQGRGQKGKLHVDGKANLFYLDDDCVLIVNWDVCGWRFNICRADAIGDDWFAGDQAFSRDP